MLMELFIETLTGVSFELHVSPMETVISVKSKIQKAEGIPVTQQHLIWKNSELDDHHRLRDYAISGGSTLRLVLGLRGGPLNAHRIPPLRLTPIHLTSSATPIISKIARLQSERSKPTKASRLMLPALRIKGFLSTIRSSSISSSSSNFNSNGSEDSENTASNRTTPKESRKIKSELEPHRGLALLTENLSRLTASDAPPPNVSQNSLPAYCRSGIRAVNPVLTPNPPEHESSYKSASDVNIQRPINKVAGDVPPIKSPALVTISQDIDSNYRESFNHIVRTSSMSPKSAKNDLKPVNSDSQQAIVEQTLESAGDQMKNSNSENSLDPLLTYPPLINPSNRSRHTLNSCDLSSCWRLYEPSDVPTLGRSTVLRNRFPIPGLTEPDNDSNSSSAPTSDRDSPTTGINVIVQSDSATNTKGGLEDLSFTNSDVSSATATILASLLSVTSDRLTLPCQTSGTERGFVHGRHPFHWLRRRTSPLFEATEDLARAIDSKTGRWDANNLDTDGLTGLPTALYESSSGERDYCEDGRELEEVDDQDLGVEEDDADEGDSVDAKDAYECTADDDDSLADLEDYLLYYRTGDLLFGPSISSIYPPYAYSDRTCLCVENWRSELETDFGISSSRERRNGGSPKHQGGSKWNQECTELAAKIQDLKTRLQEALVRRQSRQYQKDKQNDPGVLEESESVERASLETSLTNVQNGELRVSEQKDSSAHSPAKEPPRRRRFGTVIPPEPRFLVHPELNGAHSPFTQHSTDNCSSLSVAQPEVSTADDSSVLPCIAARGVVTLASPSLSANETTGVSVKFSSRNDPASCVASNSESPLSSRSLPQRFSSGTTQLQFVPNLADHNVVGTSSDQTHIPSTDESQTPVCSRLISSGGNSVDAKSSSSKLEGQSIPKPLTAGRIDETENAPRSPPKPHSPNNVRRKRCALCLRKIGIVNTYSCRCGRIFCSRHRYAEVHACPFDYKAEARRTLIDSNPVVTAPKLPKI